MVFALILSGGTGMRIGGRIPKQYLSVGGRAIIVDCLERFEHHEAVDGILVVAAAEWQERISIWASETGMKKLIGYAEAGSSRQHSIYRGLEALKQSGAKEQDVVIVHDAVRPCVSEELIRRCAELPEDADGVMPVIPVKDTMYVSRDGRSIDGLLDRDQLFAGQAPESFRFGRYYASHSGMNEQALGAVRGSSELAYRHGMAMRLVPGDERNFKITTREDLQRYRRVAEERD